MWSVLTTSANVVSLPLADFGKGLRDWLTSLLEDDGIIFGVWLENDTEM
jgi:hypothetical protein